MFSDLKKLFKHSGIYALGAIAQAGLSFLLVPFYTRFLSQSDYGRLEILQTFLKILLFLIPLGLPSAILKCYHRDAKSRNERKVLTSTAFFFVLASGVLQVLVLLFFLHPLGQFLLKTDLSLLLFLTIITALFAASLELFLAFLRAEERSHFYTAIFLLRFVLTLGITIYLVVILQWGIAGSLMGNLLSQVFTLLFFLPYLKNYVRIKISWLALTRLLSFGIAILPASIAMWVMDLSDRYFLNHFSNLAEVGIYSLGYRIGFILEFALVIPFQLAWPSFSFRIAKQKNHCQIYARALTYFFLTGIVFALFLSAFASEIVRLLAPPDYARASSIVPLISLSYVFYGLHFVLAPGIHLSGKTKYYPLAIIFPAILNLFLNYFLIPHYGMFGAAISTLISFAFLLFLTYLVSNHFYPVRYERTRIVKIGILGLAIFIFASFFSNILIKIGLLILFFLALWLIRFWEKEEINYMKSFFKKFYV